MGVSVIVARGWGRGEEGLRPLLWVNKRDRFHLSSSQKLVPLINSICHRGWGGGVMLPLVAIIRSFKVGAGVCCNKYFLPKIGAINSICCIYM